MNIERRDITAIFPIFPSSTVILRIFSHDFLTALHVFTHCMINPA